MAKIMVVNHPGLQRMMIKNIVRSENHEVIELDKGYKVLRQYDEMQPDLIILSDDLPDMDGMDVMTDLLSTHPEARVLLMVGVNHLERALQAMEAGAVGHAFIPVNRMELMETIRDILG